MCTILYINYFIVNTFSIDITFFIVGVIVTGCHRTISTINDVHTISAKLIQSWWCLTIKINCIASSPICNIIQAFVNYTIAICRFDQFFLKLNCCL